MTATNTTYIVKNGDSLHSIGRKLGIPEEELNVWSQKISKRNNINDSNSIFPNQDLFLDLDKETLVKSDETKQKTNVEVNTGADTGANEKPADTASDKVAKNTEYVVQNGDTTDIVVKKMFAASGKTVDENSEEYKKVLNEFRELNKSELKIFGQKESFNVGNSIKLPGEFDTSKMGMKTKEEAISDYVKTRQEKHAKQEKIRAEHQAKYDAEHKSDNNLENNQKQEIRTVTKNGVTEKYYPDGKKERYFDKSGIKQVLYTDKSGNRVAEEYGKDGKLVKSTTFHSDGTQKTTVAPTAPKKTKATAVNTNPNLTAKEKVACMGKGLIRSVTGMFTDEKGNFSIAQTAKTVVIGAACVAVVVATGGAATPLLVAAGAAMGTYQVSKGAINAYNAKTREQAVEAWTEVGEGTGVIAMSVAGARGALKGAGMATSEMRVAKTGQLVVRELNAFEATAKCIVSTPEVLKSSYSAVKNGGAVKNLKAANPFSKTKESGVEPEVKSDAGVKSKNKIKVKRKALNKEPLVSNEQQAAYNKEVAYQAPTKEQAATIIENNTKAAKATAESQKIQNNVSEKSVEALNKAKASAIDPAVGNTRNISGELPNGNKYVIKLVDGKPVSMLNGAGAFVTDELKMAKFISKWGIDLNQVAKVANESKLKIKAEPAVKAEISPEIKTEVKNANSKINPKNENVSIDPKLAKYKVKVEDPELFVKKNLKAAYEHDDGKYQPTGIWTEIISSTSEHCPWKMHIDARTAAEWQKVASVALPYLEERGVLFKTIRSTETLKKLAGTKQEGKAFTIYPKSQAEFKMIASELEAILKNNKLSTTAKNISGDRQLGSTGRLHYRYEWTSKNLEGQKYQSSFYDANRGDSNYLAGDMTPADDPFYNWKL